MKKNKTEKKNKPAPSAPTNTSEQKLTPPREEDAVNEGAKKATPKQQKDDAPGSGKKSPSSKKSQTGKAALKSKPITFSLEEAREIAKTNKPAATDEEKPKQAARASKEETAKAAEEHKQEARVLGAASLADILGRNPSVSGEQQEDTFEQVPKKFQRYYKTLLELRAHVQSELDQHTKDTLRRPGAEESSDRAHHSKDIADVATETFNHDFALSLVSSEQEALAEIQGAIERIHAGTYGICEITGKPINKERLQAVPFARYSVEGQAEYEKTRKKPNQRVGAYIETGDESAQVTDEDTEE
ncbi:MAG: TraR/DksA C4-type zinc finger protein [Opitutales bacterium]